MDYLSTLNEPQRCAATHIDGPLMVIAGAGSGKTKTLTTRIAYLLDHGVDAFQILALTFTNKAAQEMKERVANLLGSPERVRSLFIGTFHSVFARLLRADGEALGYPHNFSVYDTQDAQAVLKKIIQQMGLDLGAYKPRKVLDRISWAKNNLITPELYAEDNDTRYEDASRRIPDTHVIYAKYTKRCFANAAMDFDDLLLQMFLLLSTQPAMLHKYQHKFKHILIDEYQDTNPLQYRIIKMLAASHENLCVVGDDAQSIYGFRGASVDNILRFRDDYPNAVSVKLEQNYRSTKSILSAANGVIRYNSRQIEKKLWTDKSDGDVVKIVGTKTEKDEAKFVVDAISEQQLRHHYTPKDFAILYRTNAQSRVFEEQLRRANIPYKIYGGMSFYQRKEVKDFIAYLKCIVNTQDEESLLRIVNFPTRGIGNTTLEKCIVTAADNGQPLWDVLCAPASVGLRAGAIESINAFTTLIQYLQVQAQKLDAYELAMEVGKHTGLFKSLQEDRTPEGISAQENTQSLLGSIRDFIGRAKIENNEEDVQDASSLSAYLQEVMLYTSVDETSEKTNEHVSMMTLHGAKGLEFPCVFIVGVEERIFPSERSITKEDIEEERRLFYVGITRAKVKLWITYAETRYMFRDLQNNEPSRFINEVPKEFADFSYARGASQNIYVPKMQRGGNFNNVRKPLHLTPLKTTRKTSNISTTRTGFRPLPAPVHNPNFQATEDHNLFQKGVFVEHVRFGKGEVMAIEGNDPQTKMAVIRFEQDQENRRIILRYAKLRILPSSV